MWLDKCMETTLIPTNWNIERIGRGLAFARSPQAPGVVVMLTGSRGNWTADATPAGTTEHGPAVQSATQQQACENAWVAFQVQQEGMA